MARRFFLFTLAGVCIIFIGCPIGPHSRHYKPVSDWERDAFEKANREVYPQDVRDDIAKYDSARIAWPGVIQNITTRVTDTGLAIDLIIEHHYYNWIEDFSIQQEHIFLSPHGEGLFETTWYLKPDSDKDKIAEFIGDMAIVYGIPRGVYDSVIDVRAYYVRVIDQQWYATDIFEYKRHGDSLKILRIP